MAKLLTLCILASVALATVQAVRLKIKLPQNENFHREYQAHRMKRQVATSCDDVVEVPKEEITLIGRLDQLDDRVKFYRSQHAREGLEFLQLRPVPGLGGQTVVDVLQVLRENECYPFLIGGAVRDQFLGRTPRDVDVEIDCPLEKIIEVCNRVWGAHNCRNSPGSPVGHIGNSSIPGPGFGDDDIDYASTDSVFYVSLTLLEYTVNMMAYDTNGNDVILDITGTGQRDVCNKHIKISSEDEEFEHYWNRLSWELWARNNEPRGSLDYKKVWRAWKLREKGFQFLNEETRDFLVEYAGWGVQSEGIKFNDFYCDEVFDSDYDAEANECLVSNPDESCEGGLEKKFVYDSAFEEDFGYYGEDWEDIVKPSLPSIYHPCDICELAADPGPCRGSLVRYFFNTKTEGCNKFTYGGCDGNQNNFETREECRQICKFPPTKPPEKLRRQRVRFQNKYRSRGF